MDESEAIKIEVVKIKKKIEEYLEVMSIIREQNKKGEEARKEMEIMWEARLSKFTKEITKNERQLSIKRTEFLYGKRHQHRKKWFTLDNLKRQTIKGIILLFLFVVWPLIASGLWDLFKRRILVRVSLWLRYVLLLLMYFRPSL